MHEFFPVSQKSPSAKIVFKSRPQIGERASFFPYRCRPRSAKRHFRYPGILYAIIDVVTLRFVPLQYAVQVPAGVGLEFFLYISSLVWRADKKSGSLQIQEYAASIFAASSCCKQLTLSSV